MDKKPDYTLIGILNKIKISRGAPKGKYSNKIPKIRIAGPDDLTPEQLIFINDSYKKGRIYLSLVDEYFGPHKISATLPPKQGNAISFLKNAIVDLEKYNGSNPESYERLKKQYIECISECVRAGLIWHPLVFEFIYKYKALGKKEELRAIKRGLETGIKRPLTIIDIKIERYREEGKTWPQIRRTLMKRKIIKKMTCQGLQKKFKKAW